MVIYVGKNHKKYLQPKLLVEVIILWTSSKKYFCLTTIQIAKKKKIHNQTNGPETSPSASATNVVFCEEKCFLSYRRFYLCSDSFFVSLGFSAKQCFVTCPCEFV